MMIWNSCMYENQEVFLILSQILKSLDVLFMFLFSECQSWQMFWIFSWSPVAIFRVPDVLIIFVSYLFLLCSPILSVSCLNVFLFIFLESIESI